MKDARAPVLYLRSFRDDNDIKVRARASNGRILPERSIKISFEELVTDQLWGYGPVLALGDPQAQGQPAPLGAARDYPGMARWEEKVTELMQQASMILAIAGGTDGLTWEINRIVGLGLLWKLVILLPPLDVGALESRWRILKTTSLGEILPSGMDLTHIRAVFFPEGHAVLISGNRQNDWTYEAVLDEAVLIIGRSREAWRSVTSHLSPRWCTRQMVNLVNNTGETLVRMISGALIVAYLGVVLVVGQMNYKASHPLKFSRQLRDSYVTNCQLNISRENRDRFCTCVANRMADVLTYGDLEKLETNPGALEEKAQSAYRACGELTVEK
jgi:hypothetical protein